MDTKKYDDKWSSGTDKDGKGIWIDREEKKAYESTFWGNTGKERPDIVVVSNDD